MPWLHPTMNHDEKGLVAYIVPFLFASSQQSIFEQLFMTSAILVSSCTADLAQTVKVSLSSWELLQGLHGYDTAYKVT